MKEKLKKVDLKKIIKGLSIVWFIGLVVFMTIANLGFNDEFNLKTWLGNALLLMGIMVFGLLMGESIGTDKQMEKVGGLYQKSLFELNNFLDEINDILIYFVQFFQWFLTQELFDKKVNYLVMNNIDINKLISNDDIKIIQDNDNYHLLTKSRYYDNFFFSSNKTVSTRAKMFIKELLVTFDDSVSFSYDNIYITKNSANIYLVGGITSLVLTISYLTYLIINNQKLYEQIITTDKEKEITIFSKSYWQSALNAFSKTKNIVIIAMLFALMMISKLFSIPTGFADLRISFTYVFFALISMMYGPIAGLVIGLFSDTLGFFIFPNGASFFFPYTIQAILSGFIYGICLYKKEAKLENVFFARLLINMIMNVLWGSLCFGWLYNYDLSTTCAYMLMYSLPKNLIWLIPQTLVLYITLKACRPIINRNRN